MGQLSKVPHIDGMDKPPVKKKKGKHVAEFPEGKPPVKKKMGKHVVEFPEGVRILSSSARLFLNSSALMKTPLDA